MRVLVVGFDNYNELDRTMNEFIEENKCYLFSVVCGGLDDNAPASLAERWAINNGAPVINIYKDNLDTLSWVLQKETDYIIIKVTDKTPQFWKNFMMKLKSEGKHGKVVR